MYRLLIKIAQFFRPKCYYVTKIKIRSDTVKKDSTLSGKSMSREHPEGRRRKSKDGSYRKTRSERKKGK